jgi:hypothetical protein
LETLTSQDQLEADVAHAAQNTSIASKSKIPIKIYITNRKYHFTDTFDSYNTNSKNAQVAAAKSKKKTKLRQLCYKVLIFIFYETDYDRSAFIA